MLQWWVSFSCCLQVPSYISRSVAGSYDNEAVAIFALIFTFYLYIKVQSCSAFNFVVLHAIFPVSILLSLRFWCSTFILWNDGDCLVQTLNTGSLFYATLNALAYFYMVGIYFLMVIAYFTSFCSLLYLCFWIYRSSMFFQVCSWGGYTFIINLIPMHALLCIVTGRYSSRLYIAYAPLVSTSTWEPYALLIAICSGNSKVNLFAKLRKNIHKVLCHLKRSVLMSKFPSSRH